MKSKLIVKICALFVAAVVAITSVAAPVPDRKKSSRTTTTTRSHKRMDAWRQQVDKPKTTTTNKQKSSSSSSSFNWNSSSSSSSSSSATDNTNRKIFLREQIADWKLKLQKAEKSYEECIASGEDTREKQRVVESKRKSVDECLQMIRQYESELNSLK